MRVSGGGLALAGALACTPTEALTSGTGGAQGSDTTAPEEAPMAGTGATGGPSAASTGAGVTGSDPGGLDLGDGGGSEGTSSGGGATEGSGSGGENCGDGIVDAAAFELCDHAVSAPDEIETWVACVGCRPAADILFVLKEPVTIGQGPSQLHGVDGADALCRAEAESAMLPRAGECVAWLLDGTEGSKLRLEPFMEDPLARPDGALIATSLNALAVDAPQVEALHGLLGPITDDASPWVWIGFSFSTEGHEFGEDCEGWTSSMGDDLGVAGQYRPKNDQWSPGKVFNFGTTLPCFLAARLYCLCPDPTQPPEDP